MYSIKWASFFSFWMFVSSNTGSVGCYGMLAFPESATVTLWGAAPCMRFIQINPDWKEIRCSSKRCAWLRFDNHVSDSVDRLERETFSLFLLAYIMRFILSIETYTYTTNVLSEQKPVQNDDSKETRHSTKTKNQ